MTGRAAQLLELFSSAAPATVGLLEELVALESPTDDAARVTAVASFVAARLSAAGVAARTAPCEGCGSAVVASIGEERGGTLVVGHHDTVWPVGTLASRPFRRDAGTLAGPGVFDMKAGIAVAMTVLEAVARGEVRPAEGVGLYLSPDEETGSEGSSWLLLAEARRRSRVLVLEP